MYVAVNLLRKGTILVNTLVYSRTHVHRHILTYAHAHAHAHMRIFPTQTYTFSRTSAIASYNDQSPFHAQSSLIPAFFRCASIHPLNPPTSGRPVLRPARISPPKADRYGRRLDVIIIAEALFYLRSQVRIAQRSRGCPHSPDQH